MCLSALPSLQALRQVTCSEIAQQATIEHSPHPGRQMAAPLLLPWRPVSPPFWLSGAVTLLPFGLPAYCAVFSNSPAALHLQLQVSSCWAWRRRQSIRKYSTSMCGPHVLPGMHHAMLRSSDARHLLPTCTTQHLLSWQ